MTLKEKALKAREFIHLHTIPKEYECIYDEYQNKFIIFDENGDIFLSIGVTNWSKYEYMVQETMHYFYEKFAKQSYKQGQENVRMEMKRVLGLDEMNGDDD